jgi:energy-coupling factor transporter ATP-binding protein EcfA2
MLDPVARHDFMATVLTAAAEDGVSVLLSSHVLAELERVADYLILLSRGRVQVAGEVAIVPGNRPGRGLGSASSTPGNRPGRGLGSRIKYGAWPRHPATPRPSRSAAARTSQ